MAGESQYTNFNVVVSGVQEGVTAATQLQSIPCNLVLFTAGATNTGNVCLGGSGVTLSTNATNTTGGLELDAGVTIGPLPVSNLSNFYCICTSTADYLTYMILR